MGIRRFAGIFYAIVSFGIVAFHVAMAIGAPWGDYAMGGAFPGQFPILIRVFSLVQVLILLFFVVVILSCAGLVFSALYHKCQRLAWGAVAFSVVGFILNLISPSIRERIVWTPVAFILLVCSFLVVRPPKKTLQPSGLRSSRKGDIKRNRRR